MRYIILLAIAVFGCASVNSVAESDFEKRTIFYQGILQENETLVFQGRNDGKFDVIKTDIQTGTIENPFTSSGIDIQIEPVDLFLFIPKELNLNDYLLNIEPWNKDGCKYTITNSSPTYLLDSIAWRHTIRSDCKKSGNGLFVFSSRFGLKAFFILPVKKSPIEISGYVISASSTGLAASN